MGATRRDFLAASGAAAAFAWLSPARAMAGQHAWVDRRSYGPFQVAGEFPLATLEGTFAELSRLEQELRRTLGVPPAYETVEVFLLANEAAHRALLTQLYPRVPYRRALYVQRDRQAAVYAYRHPELPVDLRHECTHALLHANLAMVPLWLDEGLAEYFEMPEAQRAFAHPHLATLKWNLRLGMQRTVESLESAADLSDMGGVEYRFSWAWVHFMLHGPVAAHRALVQFVADIRRGTPPGALSARLHAAVPDLERRMVQHFKQWRSAA
ncbi:MAG TPA: hypothetical protein VEQ85_08435 [Lacipirellulaceae bacterium]|nr:hypothetical protein [Lacipirellulaceae bacterium]